MEELNTKSLHELCELVVKEQDPDKQLVLVQQINRLLDERAGQQLRNVANRFAIEMIHETGRPSS